MVKADATLDGRRTLLFGLDAENLSRMVDGDPVQIKLGDFDGMPDVDVLIFVATDQVVKALIRRVGPDTEVHYDPRRADVPPTPDGGSHGAQ